MVANNARYILNIIDDFWDKVKPEINLDLNQYMQHIK
jgi:hypothetical protein